MTSDQYRRMTAGFRRHPFACHCLTAANRASTAAVYGLYLCFIVFQIWNKDVHFLQTVLVPAISFLLLSVFRDRINAPRPYECLPITPLIQKNTKGHSFPSRHVFSVYVIAVTLGTQYLWLGIVLSIIGLFMCVIRVIGGVHFPKDVIVGMLLGIASGLLGTAIAAYFL